jgi:hypothetical protein
MNIKIRSFCLTLSVFLGGVNGAAAQSVNHSDHVHSQGIAASTSAMIDGAVHPELITDQEAITVFWISIMEPPEANEIAKNRFAAKTGKINLSPSDSAILWAAAQAFYRDFMPYRERAQQLAEAAVGKRASADTPYSIAQQRATVAINIDQLALATHQSLLTRLSPAAGAAFKTNLADVKAHMKIVPPPHM